MYIKYFGLSENPFNLTPDQKYLFLSHHHNEALDHLLYGIHERKGFIAISGGIGTGKTTLCRTLLNQLEPLTKTALVFNTSISDKELLETINQEFGITMPGEKVSKRVLLDRLNRFLLDNYRKNINSVLILDEAQNLTAEPLERLRMLSNLETEKDKLLQIVFFGQPELTKLLASPSLSQLNERITVRYDLQPLDRREVASYIDHRLLVAGGRRKVRFTGRAIDAVFARSEGNPRRINAICDRALLIAYCKDESSINKYTIRRAAENIQGHFNMAGVHKQRLSRKRFTQTVSVIAMVAITANFAGWNLRETVWPLFSAVEKITAVQAKAFFPQPDFVPEIPEAITRQIVRKPIEDLEDISGLMMDEPSSLSGLFKLFDVKKVEKELSSGEIYPGLFSFKGDPALYRQLVRPFRMRIRANKSHSYTYLLITEVTVGGAIGLDDKGRKRTITDKYLLDHWDGEMSWVYPYDNVSEKLTKGMNGLAVLKIQQMLQQLGYGVEPRGIFDRTTFEELMRFQLNHGLKANGVVETPTKALLYQMTG